MGWRHGKCEWKKKICEIFLSCLCLIVIAGVMRRDRMTHDNVQIRTDGEKVGGQIIFTCSEAVLTQWEHPRDIPAL